MGVSDARQRAEQLQEEAKNLVTDALMKLQNLNGNLSQSLSLNLSDSDTYITRVFRIRCEVRLR